MRLLVDEEVVMCEKEDLALSYWLQHVNMLTYKGCLIEAMRSSDSASRVIINSLRTGASLSQKIGWLCCLSLSSLLPVGS